MPNASLFLGISIRGVITDEVKESLKNNKLQVEYLHSCCKVFSVIGHEICPPDDNSFAMINFSEIAQKRRSLKKVLLKLGFTSDRVDDQCLFVIPKKIANEKK